MNIVSNHNRLLRGAAIPTAGGDMWTSGLEYTQNGEISGYSGSAFYQQECPCDSAAIVDSAFNKSTAWVDEQNYLTAHQDVTNLPYVQNSALESSPQGLISGISGSGLYAISAEGALNTETANFAHTANMAYSADEANASKWASSAEYVYNGWEVDGDNKITGYSGTAFAANNDYSGISPIVVNNELHIISAESAKLGVQTPLYFVEDTSSSTVIGIYESAISGRDWTDDITAASANALSEAINQITAVDVANSALTANYSKSADSATYDNLGREITATYLTAVTGDNTPYSAGPNIVINNHVIGLDSAVELTNITANRGTILDPSGLYVSDLDQSDYTEIGLDHVVSTNGSASIGWQVDNKEISISVNSGNGDYAILHMTTADVMLEERHQDPTPDKTYSLTGACSSAISAINMITSGDNQAYSAGANIDITNHVVSGKDWTTEIQNASSYAVDQATAQIPAVTGLPYVENSALAYTPGGHLVSSISGDALYAVSANYVGGGWEFNTANQITGYSGSAFAATGGGGNVYDGVAPIVVNNVEDKISANTIELSAGTGIDITETANKVVISCTGGVGKVYTGVSPIVVNNTQTTGVISAKTASFGVQAPLYFVEDTTASTVIGFSGIQIVSNSTEATATGVIYFVTGA